MFLASDFEVASFSAWAAVLSPASNSPLKYWKIARVVSEFRLGFAEADVRVGGRFRAEMSNGSETHTVHGSYREILAPERIVFTWIRDNTDGVGVETVVTVTLVAEGERTRLTLHHALFGTVADRDAHQGGWSSCLDNRLTRYLAAAA